MHSFIQNQLLFLEVQSFSQLLCYCLSRAKRIRKKKGLYHLCLSNWIPLLARITNLYMAGRLANLLKKKNSAYSFSEQ